MGFLKKLTKSVGRAFSKVASAPFKLVSNASSSLMKRVVGALTPKMPSLEIPTSSAATTTAGPQMSYDPETAAARRASLKRRRSGGISALTVARSSGLSIPQ